MKGREMRDVYFVVLAGGSGERLWPLSSSMKPKQLIPFINGRSLLEQTLQRISPLAKNKNHVLVVTNVDQQDAVKKTVGKQATVIAEPAGRNTAPAALLSCFEISEKNENAVVVILPSDHFIPEVEKFVSILWASIAYASCYDQLVLLGVNPTYPATGYGYIQYKADSLVPGWTCFPVQKFHEKPDKEKAQEYIAGGNMLWNIGIYAARIKVLLGQYQQLAPGLWEEMCAYKKNEKKYDQLSRISIDYAIAEKSDKVVVFPAHFEWHDVGTLPSFLTLKAHHEKDASTHVINVDAQDNIVCSTKKVVAFVGVENLCVVETDEALLVVAQDRVESVRNVSSFIKEQGKLHEDSPKKKMATETCV